MLESASLAAAESLVRTRLAAPEPQAVDPDRPLTKEEQKERVRAGLERDRRARAQAQRMR